MRPATPGLGRDASSSRTRAQSEGYRKEGKVKPWSATLASTPASRPQGSYLASERESRYFQATSGDPAPGGVLAHRHACGTSASVLHRGLRRRAQRGHESVPINRRTSIPFLNRL